MIVEKLSDAPPPGALLAPLLARERPFLLESTAAGGPLGRFSFAGADPVEVLESRPGGEDPLTALRTLLRARSVPSPGLPTPLPAGTVGVLAYDLGRRLERLPELAADDLGMPELSLAHYDAVVTWDHATGETWLATTGRPGRIRDLRALCRAARPPSAPLPRPLSPLRSTFTRDAYLRAVARAKELIAAGDVFQVNLSQRFSTRTEEPGTAIYARLARGNPAPFAAFLGLSGEAAVISASPERFLRLSGARVETVPIKGTRPRGRDAAEDRALARELLESEKDRAELTMIVDLLRNDLGRVARFGSVRVAELPGLTSHRTVHHLHGRVTATLAEDKDVVDLLRAAFPGGSVTGAPKVRAMEIIEEIEPVRRGAYTGAIGYFSVTGETDLNVAIRTIQLREGRASFSVGGGIVADSDPADEYEETLHKGRGLAASLGFSW